MLFEIDIDVEDLRDKLLIETLEEEYIEIFSRLSNNTKNLLGNNFMKLKQDLENMKDKFKTYHRGKVIKQIEEIKIDLSQIDFRFNELSP